MNGNTLDVTGRAALLHLLEPISTSDLGERFANGKKRAYKPTFTCAYYHRPQRTRKEDCRLLRGGGLLPLCRGLFLLRASSFEQLR